VAFNDDGVAGDAAAGDGVHSLFFRPKLQGFAGLFGQIRVEAVLQLAASRLSLFSMFSTRRKRLPRGKGAPREALESGSLHFELKLDVREAGRYVVNGRVDDAAANPVAFLSFNEPLAVGPQEIRLTLFGKLALDAKAVFPLTLRDVDGFLLHESTFPDRSLLPRLSGTVHVSGEYPLASFSGSEWQAEERTRYLAEFGRDVAHGRKLSCSVYNGGRRLSYVGRRHGMLRA
jgi:hypothetical protein